MVSSEVEALIDAADSMPTGPAQVAAWEQAVAAADALGEISFQIDARIGLASSYFWVPSGSFEFPTYAWLLRQLDGDAVGPDERARILWFGKWSMTRMLDTPEIELPVVREGFAELQRRFAEEGYSEHAFAQHRTLLALAADSDAEVDRWLARWRGAPRDGLSDCLACERVTLATVLSLRGDAEAALEQVRETLAGDIGCAEEPATSLSYAAGWLASLGSADEAREAHLRGWRLSEGDPSQSDSVARHLVFLVRSGNGRRAVRLLIPRLGWQKLLQSAAARMHFAAAAAVVLRAGLADDVDFEAAGWSVDALGSVTEQVASLEATATTLAAQFDRRNQTTAMSTQLAEWARTDPYATPVDFGVLSEEAIPAQPEAETDDAQAESAPTEIALPDSALGYAELMRRAIETLDTPVAARLHASWLERRTDLSSAGSGRLHDAAVAYLDRRAGLDALSNDDGELAQELLAASLDAGIRAGDVVEQLRTRVGLAAARIEVDATAKSEGLSCVAELEAGGHAAEAAGALVTLAVLPEPRENVAMCRRAAELYERVGNRVWQGLSTVRAAWLALDVDLDESAALATLASEQLPADAPSGARVSLTHLRARLALSAQNPVAAADCFRVEIASVQGNSAVKDGYRLSLCDVLIEADDWAGLEAEAAQLRANARARGLDVLAAQAQRYWGLALCQSGRVLEGAEALEAAVTILDRAQDPAYAPACWALGEALSALGDEANARVVFGQAAEAFAEAGREREAGRAYERAANCAWGSEDPATATSLYDQACSYADRSGDLGLFVQARRNRAAAMTELGDLEAGLAALAAVAAECEAMAIRLGEEDAVDLHWLRMSLHRQAGAVLANHGQTARAQAAANLAAAGLANTDPDEAWAAWSEAARYRAEDGLTAELEARMRECLAELQQRGYPAERVRLAGALAELLELADRDDEADQVWEHFGPDADD